VLITIYQQGALGGHSAFLRFLERTQVRASNGIFSQREAAGYRADSNERYDHRKVDVTLGA
jgi:hypothetical protein